MSSSKKKGLITGTLGVFFVGLQPVVANARPEILDAHIFAAMTCLIESLIFFPLMLLELRRNQSSININRSEIQENMSTLKKWRKNYRLLIFMGIIFGLNQLLFFIGYELAGAINGSLVQKTTVFFGMIFGYLILKEKITNTQILFSFVLFSGLYIAITQGSFNFFNFNLNILFGVLILLFISGLWMFGHSVTKSVFDRNEITPTQMVFLRNILSGSILISTYFLFFPIENLNLFLDPINIFWFFAMGSVYGTGLFLWYLTLSNIDVSKATIILSPTPMATALFAVVLLGESFTIFHIFGTIIVVVSIIMIVRKRKEKRKDQEDCLINQ